MLKRKREIDERECPQELIVDDKEFEEAVERTMKDKRTRVVFLTDKKTGIPIVFYTVEWRENKIEVTLSCPMAIYEVMPA